MINWIRFVKHYQNFVNKIKDLYYKYNKIKDLYYKYNKNNNHKNIYKSWINETIDKNQRIKKYENYCKNIININN